VGLLQEKLTTILAEQTNFNVEIKWDQYESDKVTKKDGNTVTRKVLKTKMGLIGDLVTELVKQAESIPLHLFRASWQGDQFRNLTKNLPDGWIVMVLDFAENYACTLQDEAQSCHWHHEQVTVHPVVAYYKCDKPECKGAAVTESLVVISDDKKHDHHAVRHFVTTVNRFLQAQRSIDIAHEVHFTDGCSSQYKSKGPFYDISLAINDYGFTLERCFFGSRHGKGPSDGESAVVKRKASVAVAAGSTVIRNEEEFFRFAVENMTKESEIDGICNHFRRTFFWVGTETIKRDRDQTRMKTLPGTRLLHSVKCVDKGCLGTRKLSCFCRGCVSGVGECSNTEYVEPWKLVQLKGNVTDMGQGDNLPPQSHTLCILFK
jgi:hypothetical protein